MNEVIILINCNQFILIYKICNVDKRFSQKRFLHFLEHLSKHHQIFSASNLSLSHLFVCDIVPGTPFDCHSNKAADSKFLKILTKQLINLVLIHCIRHYSNTL